jgi:hypothetical protein
MRSAGTGDSIELNSSSFMLEMKVFLDSAPARMLQSATRQSEQRLLSRFASGNGIDSAVCGCQELSYHR